MDTATYSVSETLRDGKAILIRAIRQDDKQRLLRLFHGLSPQSVYHRFFGFKRSLSEEELRRLTEIDFVNYVGLAAAMGSNESENFIGVGRYIRTENPGRAEVSLAVLDEYHGHGIGTLLLKHLAEIAKRNGISEFEADVLSTNRQMLEVFRNSSFRIHDHNESGIVHLTLDIGM